jgi:hypothetical protein
MTRCLLTLLLLGTSLSAAANDFAIVLRDDTALRPAPSSAARPHTLLAQGETLEVRGERLEYLQVYDHRRERGGFVRASQVRRLSLTPQEAPELLAILRFLRGAPGNEPLGIAFAAAYIEAAPPEALNGAAGVEALDAFGTLAERLARGRRPNLDVVTRYGVRFVTVERNGRLRLCYDGAAFRRLLAMAASDEQRARAALALTAPDCQDSDLPPPERRQVDEWRAQVLDAMNDAALPGYLRNRVLARRASVWSSLAWQRERQGGDAHAAAERARLSLDAMDPAQLAEGDGAAYREAVVRVAASRWALATAPSPVPGKAPHVVMVPGEEGQTCVLLVDGRNGMANPLAKRCTYAVVWTASATLNREGDALALAVQPTDAWRELWLFRKTKAGWKVRIIPPAAVNPDVGYAEFAGWARGGRVRILREAVAEGRVQNSVRLASLGSAPRTAPARGKRALASAGE